MPKNLPDHCTKTLNLSQEEEQVDQRVCFFFLYFQECRLPQCYQAF